MTEEQIRAGIAKAVCVRFIDMHSPTPRHSILVEFENPDLLDEMERHSLISAAPNREAYLPTVGTFALLGDDHELYQSARTAYERTIYALWNLYRSEGSSVDHEPAEFEEYANKLYASPAPPGLIALGLYLVKDFGALSPIKMSDNKMTVESFRVTEQLIKMRDPAPWWTWRVQGAREPLPRFAVPGNDLSPMIDEEAAEAVSDPLDEVSFWPLIHPAVEIEARSRFETGHYADAVEWALKVVAQEVRRRTGLTIDGSDLMHKAFSPNRPYLVFDDPIPSTQDSMQQGYMEVFAGTMTGVRNPKAHGMVRLDRRRCIHFLFLASLLADKIDEAIDAP